MTRHLSAALLLTNATDMNRADRPLTLVFPVTSFIKCKLAGALRHQELLEQGLDHFSHGVCTADVKCVHTPSATGWESPGVGWGLGRFAEFHLHLNEASVNPI